MWKNLQITQVQPYIHIPNHKFVSTIKTLLTSLYMCILTHCRSNPIKPNPISYKFNTITYTFTLYISPWLAQPTSATIAKMLTILWHVVQDLNSIPMVSSSTLSLCRPLYTRYHPQKEGKSLRFSEGGYFQEKNRIL